MSYPAHAWDVVVATCECLLEHNGIIVSGVGMAPSLTGQFLLAGVQQSPGFGAVLCKLVDTADSLVFVTVYCPKQLAKHSVYRIKVWNVSSQHLLNHYIPGIACTMHNSLVRRASHAH